MDYVQQQFLAINTSLSTCVFGNTGAVFTH